MIDPFVWCHDNSLAGEFCTDVISKFDKDERQYEGRTGGGYTPTLKNSKDLVISTLPDWATHDAVFAKALTVALQLYNAHLRDVGMPFDLPHMRDTGYQIQKYDASKGFYGWHSDYLPATHVQNTRLYAFIWYLNDVSSGGETQFLQDTVRPRVGKLLIFPATWTCVHKGCQPVSNAKYICTGWLHQGNDVL